MLMLFANHRDIIANVERYKRRFLHNEMQKNNFYNYGGALPAHYVGGAFAYKVGEARVAIGANLDSEQIAAVYSDFGIERGVIPEITVTNRNERQYLEGLVDDKKIGHKAISACISQYWTTAPD